MSQNTAKSGYTQQCHFTMTNSYKHSKTVNNSPVQLTSFLSSPCSFHDHEMTTGASTC